MKKFQNASDRILDGSEITFKITDQTESLAVDARSFPVLGYISLRTGFFEYLRSGKKSTAIRTIVHELGRMYGDQDDSNTGKPGDVVIWDGIAALLYTYRNEMCGCK